MYCSTDKTLVILSLLIYIQLETKWAPHRQQIIKHSMFYLMPPGEADDDVEIVIFLAYCTSSPIIAWNESELNRGAFMVVSFPAIQLLAPVLISNHSILLAVEIG